MIGVESLESKNETFVKGTYNGIEIISRKSDGFVNATKMVHVLRGTSDGQFRRFLRENQGWREYFDEFKKDFYSDENVRIEKKPDLIVNCQNCYEPQFRGIYVHPGLINYIAMWASPRYAVYVGKVMDAINNKVHEKLEVKGLEDNPTNAIEVLDEIVEPLFSVRTNESRESQCWGVRDSPYKLNQWEIEDVRNLKQKIKAATETLNNLMTELDSWGKLAEQVD